MSYALSEYNPVDVVGLSDPSLMLGAFVTLETCGDGVIKCLRLLFCSSGENIVLSDSVGISETYLALVVSCELGDMLVAALFFVPVVFPIGLPLPLPLPPLLHLPFPFSFPLLYDCPDFIFFLEINNSYGSNYKKMFWYIFYDIYFT